MITARAFLVGIVGFCFYLIALVNTLPSYYYALTWLTLGILVSSFGMAVLSMVGLKCEWRMAPASVSESAATTPEAGSTLDAGTNLSGAMAEVRLSNSGSISKTGLVIELRLFCKPRDETRKRRFVVESLAAGASIDAALSLSDLPRGTYRMTEVLVIGSDVLGLFRMRRKLRPIPDSAAAPGEEQDEAGGGEIIMGPTTVSLRGASPSAGGTANEGHDATRMVGLSDDIGGTRAYVPGDDLRHVHWKSTARQNQLVVKEYHRAAQLQSSVIWDGAAQTTWGEGMLTSTEWGLSLAASLCRAFIESGRPCDLLRLDDTPLLVPLPARVSNPETTMARAAEALAFAAANRERPLSLSLSTFLSRLLPGSTAYLITASLSPDVHRAVEQLRSRSVHVVVGLIDGSAFPGTTDDADTHAADASAAPPQQTWKASEDGSLKAGEAAVTSDSYRAQAQLFRSAGVPVVLIPAEPGPVSRDFGPPLRAALTELMGTRYRVPASLQPARVS